MGSKRALIKAALPRAVQEARKSDRVRKTVGNLNRSGRKRGVPNKTTASVKAALAHVFDERGGVAALLAWADEDPTAFYKLWGRMLPTEQHVSGADGGPLTLEALVAASRQ